MRPEQVVCRQHHRFFDLALAYRPVAPQQPHLFLIRHQTEPAPFVKPHGPGGGFPGADQNSPVRLPLEMLEKQRSDSAALLCGSRVRMTDQRDIGDVLQAHHAHDAPFAAHAEKLDASRHLGADLVERHVGIVPAIGRDDAAIRDRAVVHDLSDQLRVSDLFYLQAASPLPNRGNFFFKPLIVQRAAPRRMQPAFATTACCLLLLAAA